MIRTAILELIRCSNGTLVDHAVALEIRVVTDDGIRYLATTIASHR